MATRMRKEIQTATTKGIGTCIGMGERKGKETGTGAGMGTGMAS